MAEKVLGFQFEPRRKERCESSDSWETCSERSLDEDIEMNEDNELVGTISRISLDSTEWCTCRNCSVMPREKENLCCRELMELDYFKIAEGDCIINHPSFAQIVLLQDALWTALVILKDLENIKLHNRDKVPMDAYRYAAYRQFIWFTHNRLGKRIRRVIPSCVVNKIRQTFPSPNGTYKGYKDNDDDEDSSETNFAWVFER